MKKNLVGLGGLAVVLASCGSSGIAPDASASLRITQIKTEYRTSSGQYVACDNVSNGSTLSQRTAVAAYFAIAGNVQSVNIGLRGNTTSEHDNNYNTTASGEQLQQIGGGDFKVTFLADSSVGMLPSSIVVTPAPVMVKTVVPTGNALGSFYTEVRVNTGTSTFTRTSQGLSGAGNIPVYSGCNVVGTTSEEL